MATGVLKTRVLSPRTFRASYLVPDEVGVMQVKNVGLDSIMIWFDDELVKESYVLAPNEKLPEVSIRAKKTIVNYQAITDQHPKIQLLFWDK